jgi:Tol biopolymer transport system component
MGGRFSWSASGDSILFVDASRPGERSLAVLDLRSLSVTPYLTFAAEAWISDAILSGDGRTIAFTHTPTLSAGAIDYQVWSVLLGQRVPEAQTTGRVDFDPAWGGDGWLYFCRGTLGPPNIPEVWRTRPGDLASARAVTSDPSVYKFCPSSRPGDDRVVFEGRRREDPPGISALYSVDPAAGSCDPLTAEGRYGDSSPFWNPDGRSVVFISNRCGHAEVWTLDVTTGALGQLTRGPRGCNRICARWSPDGTRLAVLDGRTGGWSSRGRIEIHGGGAAAP